MNQEQKFLAILIHEIPEKWLKYMGEDLKNTYEELIGEIKKRGPGGIYVQVLTAVLQKLIRVPAKRVVLALAPIVAQLQGKPVSELPEDIKQKVENLKKRVGQAIEETAKLQEEIKDLLQVWKTYAI